jgi:hypothetical protein
MGRRLEDSLDKGTIFVAAVDSSSKNPARPRLQYCSARQLLWAALS